MQTGTSPFLMVSLQLALSPQFASLVGAGIMLLLMMKMARFFYRLPNVSRPDQMPESDHILVGASLRGTAFCSSPVVAPGYFWFLSFKITASTIQDFPGGSDGNESICNAGDLGLIPGLGRSPGEGHGNGLQYSCLENPEEQRSLAGYTVWGHKESNITE